MMFLWLVGLLLLPTAARSHGAPSPFHSPTKDDISLDFFTPPPDKICHYSTIGFPTPYSVEDMMQQTKEFVENPRTKMIPPTLKDRYRMFHLGTKSGAELWNYIDHGNEVSGLDPHFAGPSRLKVCLTKATWDLERSTMVLEGRAGPHHQNEYDLDDLPLHLDFDCPTSHLWEEDLPATSTAQIAAFAHEVQVFESAQHFQEYKKKDRAEGRITFADHAFASWSVLAGRDTNKRNRSTAMFTGHVVQSEVKINDETGKYFYWALVETLGGCQFDVVIHPDFIEKYGQPPPKPGCIVQGVFWLSGHLLGEDQH